MVLGIGIPQADTTDPPTTLLRILAEIALYCSDPAWPTQIFGCTLMAAVAWLWTRRVLRCDLRVVLLRVRFCGTLVLWSGYY
jgi:hypothetical protein